MDKEYGKNQIKNSETERNFLSGLYKYPEALFEIESFLSEKDFYFSDLGKIYSIFKYLIIDKQFTKLDHAIVLSTVKNLGYTFSPQCNITNFMQTLAENSKSLELKTVYTLGREIMLFSRRREIWECGSNMQKKIRMSSNAERRPM